MSTSPSFRSRKLPLILILLIGVLSASAITFGDTFLLQGDAHEGLSSAALSHTQQIGSGTSVRAASVSTDKSDYKPGEIVQITGSGFAPNEPVTLQVVHIQPTTLQFSSLLSSESAYDHAGHEPWQVLVGADGSFTSTWLVQEDSLNQTLLLTADQPATAGHAAIHAETTFTDSSIETYDQCSNDDGDGYASGDTGCRWINGNLNKNNSTYREGEATVQRLAIYEFVPGSTHTVTLQYGTTKAGKHAYDFLTTWDWSEDWIALADRCQDLDGCTTAAETYFDIPQDSNVPDGFEPSAPGDRQMTMRGGTLTGVSAPGLVSGDYSGDSETAVTVSFTVANSGPMCSTKGGTTTCGVALWFGAHIAKGDDWGPPGGASDIPGSPYHVSLDKLDGEAIGERDNQMQSDTVIPPPNLVISKTAANTPINAGDVASFTITVTNTGTGPANNVTMSDQLPAGIVWTDNSAACTISAGGLLSCSFGNLAAGASVSVTVSGTTDAADCGTLNNLATAQADNNAPVQDDASIVVNCPDIVVTKVADQGTVSAGTAIGFTITVTNNGPGSATGVTLSDTLPTNGGLSWSIDGGTGAASCSIVGGVLSCNFGTLANGATRTVHITSPTTSATCGTVNNTVTVAATNEASANTTNNSASASVIVQCPNIAVTKVADQATVTAGTAIGFTLTVSNSGPGSATGVTLTDTLPTNGGLSWSINGGTGAAQCSIAAGVLSCNFGTLASGASVTVHITSPTTSATCGVVNNTGTVAATNEPSANTGNNSASASVTVNCPDIRVQKTAANTPISAGDVASFTITISNIGAGSATGVTLTDPLPAGVAWAITGGTGAASCTNPIVGNNLSCNFGTMAAGASFTVIVSGTTDAADCGTLNNTATGAATNEPSNVLANNSASASIVVQCPGVSISKTADASPVSAGSQIGFTVTVSNSNAAGTGTATGVTVNDPLPAGLTWAIDGPANGYSIVAGVLVFGPADLAPGASASVHIVATTTAANCATIPNTATVTVGNGTAPPPAQASVVVQCPDIRVQKSAANSPIGAGAVASFTITISNIGAGSATGVTLTDPLPAGVAWAITGGTGAASCTNPIVGNTLSCNFGTMAAGASLTVIVSGTTDAADCGTLNNTATGAATNEPSNVLGNNSASASIIVLCGRLLIDKITIPALDLSSFPFTGTFAFSLADGTALFDSGPIAPGSYPITEGAFAGWVLTALACNDTNSTVASTTNLQTRTATVNVEAGETVTCVFTNSQLPTLKVRKVIQGQSETFNFAIAGNPTNPPNTSVSLTPAADDEAQSTAQTIEIGAYSVTETPIPAGWLLTDASCVSDQPTNFVTDNTGLPTVTFTARYGDDIVCSFFDSEQGGATRTQGFWSTHTVLTNAIWNGTALPEGTSSITPVPVIGSADQYLCKPPVGDPPTGGTAITAIPAAGQNQVLGGFWSNIAKKSDNKKRNDLDQARMQFLQQYLAAVLNVHAFGTVIGTTTLAQARTAYCGNNAGAIMAQKNLLAAYNEAGDNVEFTPGVNATAKLSREQANIPFWDTTFR